MVGKMHEPKPKNHSKRGNQRESAYTYYMFAGVNNGRRLGFKSEFQGSIIIFPIEKILLFQS